MGRAERQALASQKSRILETGSPILKMSVWLNGMTAFAGLRCWMQVSRLKSDRDLAWKLKVVQSMWVLLSLRSSPVVACRRLPCCCRAWTLT